MSTTLADQLQTVLDCKDNIKDAITLRGGFLSSGVFDSAMSEDLTEYAAQIAAIEGVPVENTNVAPEWVVASTWGLQTNRPVTFYDNRGVLQSGTIPVVTSAWNIIPSAKDQKIDNKVYANGFTVMGDNNLVPANIVSGVSIFGVSGAATASGVVLSDTTAGASDVRSGAVFYNSDGVKTSGSLGVYSGSTYIKPTVSDITIPGSSIVDSAITVSGDANLIAKNIAEGVTIFGIDGTHKAGVVDISDTTAVQGGVISGAVFYKQTSSGGALARVSGTMPPVASSSITPSASDTVVSAGQYLSANLTVEGDANLVGSNIVSGTSIFGVDGTFKGEKITTGYVFVSDGKILFRPWDGGADEEMTAVFITNMHDRPNPEYK